MRDSEREEKLSTLKGISAACLLRTFMRIALAASFFKKKEQKVSLFYLNLVPFRHFIVLF